MHTKLTIIMFNDMVMVMNDMFFKVNQVVRDNESRLKVGNIMLFIRHNINLYIKHAYPGGRGGASGGATR